jgi:penicillin-binding protein 1A
LPAWINYMREALRDLPEEPLELPAGMYQLRIDPETGHPAPPEQKKAIVEAFQIGSSPGAAASGDGASGGLAVPPVPQPVESAPPDLF